MWHLHSWRWGVNKDYHLKPLLPPVCQVLNFSGPLTLSRGCWHVLSLQLLSKTVPVNSLFSLSLHTSFGTVLNVPMYFRPTPFKVKKKNKQAVDYCQYTVKPDLFASQMCWHCYVCQQEEVVFEAERACGQPCSLRLSETGESLLRKPLHKTTRIRSY